MSSRIEDYAVVGDLQTAALIARDGSIDWLCMPDFDSPACFAALLDSRHAGRWQLAPTSGGTCSRRRYLGDSLVLESVWESEQGAVRVVDFMPPRGSAPDIVRIVECIEGQVEMHIDLLVRFDYGHVAPWVRTLNGRWMAVAGGDSVWVDTPVTLRGNDEDRSTMALFTVSKGERVPFVFTWSASHLPPPKPVDPERALSETLDYWSGWISRCTYNGRYGEAVRRSLITLKGLTYAPTGGVVAAATTSLPEEIGGVRNWDYRYCWLRDAAFTLQALSGSGFVEEATAWRQWLLRAVAGDPSAMQIMYSLDGSRRLPEYELPWLAGYENSPPVRVGNAAVAQFQLDVYGEVLDALHAAREAGLNKDEDAWRLQVAILEFLAEAWRGPDSGLWEVRGPERHFVHSKVMAWVGFDRMIRTAERSGLGAPLERWRAERDAIHAQVCAHGWDETRGSFTQFYGSRGLDAALLLIPRLGFLPPDDPRVRSTVRAVQRELCEDGFVLRYRPEADPTGDHGTVDGLPGREGAFLACSFWLADALALMGEREEAVALFERLLALCNDVGVLSEMWDPGLGRLLGNTPQAFSHVELVNTALALGSDDAVNMRGGASGTDRVVEGSTSPTR